MGGIEARRRALALQGKLKRKLLAARLAKLEAAEPEEARAQRRELDAHYGARREALLSESNRLAQDCRESLRKMYLLGAERYAFFQANARREIKLELQQLEESCSREAARKVE